MNLCKNLYNAVCLYFNDQRNVKYEPSGYNYNLNIL